MVYVGKVKGGRAFAGRNFRWDGPVPPENTRLPARVSMVRVDPFKGKAGADKPDQETWDLTFDVVWRDEDGVMQGRRIDDLADVKADKQRWKVRTWVEVLRPDWEGGEVEPSHLEGGICWVVIELVDGERKQFLNVATMEPATEEEIDAWMAGATQKVATTTPTASQGQADDSSYDDLPF